MGQNCVEHLHIHRLPPRLAGYVDANRRDSLEFFVVARMSKLTTVDHVHVPFNAQLRVICHEALRKLVVVLCRAQRRNMVAKSSSRTSCKGCLVKDCESTADHDAVSRHDMSRQNTTHHTHHCFFSKDGVDPSLDQRLVCTETPTITVLAQKT